MNAIGDPPTAPPVTIFAIPNIRRFLAFRLLFGVRFYYPVFAVLFLDFGLSIGQFTVLNAIWAGPSYSARYHPAPWRTHSVGARCWWRPARSWSSRSRCFASSRWAIRNWCSRCFAQPLAQRSGRGIGQRCRRGAGHDSLKACGRGRIGRACWPR